MKNPLQGDHMTTTNKKVEDNPLFKFGPPRIQTAEDAMYAFLRDEITEDELVEAAGIFGHTNDTLWVNPALLERPDDAFENTLPDSLFKRNDTRVLKVDERLKLAEAKEDVREAATNASEKVVATAKPFQEADLLKNEKAAQAAEKPQEKLDKLAGDLATPDEAKSTKK
jgi:hypothetical protein